MAMPLVNMETEMDQDHPLTVEGDGDKLSFSGGDDGVQELAGTIGVQDLMEAELVSAEDIAVVQDKLQEIAIGSININAAH